MNLRRSFAASAALLAVAGVTLAAQPTLASPVGVDRKPAVKWKPCPTYSDEVLEAMLPADAIPKFRELWARTDCGTVSVPLDYRRPDGRKIEVAITRLKATDQAHRLGSLALNPGGPGGSGYLMPIQLALREETAQLNKRYDLIGFDPRGVGYSTKVNCEGGDGGSRPSGEITEAEARQVYADLAAVNQRCSAQDPAFIGQLTTGNIVRDLDRVRAALGERRLNYFGVSWGSWLGPVYRSLFPATAGKVWVDSVAPTDPRMDTFVQLRAMATERDFDRMAAWMARFDDTYGFGDTAAEVKAAIVALKADFDAHPRQFTDIDFPIDGEIIALSGAQVSPVWPLAARVLADLRDATGPTAPESLKQAIGTPDSDEPPPAGMPEQGNQTAGHAIFCNGDGGARDFESAWAAYQNRLREFPVTGSLSSFVPACAGWSLPVERIRLQKAGGPLVLSGHRWESVSVYEWTAEMQAAVGGLAFTVEDDVHGSALEECFGNILSFFETGRPGASGCQGVPMPTGPDDQPSEGLNSLVRRPSSAPGPYSTFVGYWGQKPGQSA
ncbi:alpha/beta hydrolase family protein [Flindersiella endophytica]